MESNGTINDEQATKPAMPSNDTTSSQRSGSNPTLRRSQSWPPAVCALGDPDDSTFSTTSDLANPQASTSTPYLPSTPEVRTRQIDLTDMDPQKVWALFQPGDTDASPRGALPEYLALDTMQHSSPSHSIGSRSAKSGGSAGTYTGSDSSRSVVTQVDNVCSALEKKTSFRKAMGDKWAHFVKKSSPSHVKKSLHFHRRRSKERSSSTGQDVKGQQGGRRDMVTNSPHELSYEYDNSSLENQADGDGDEAEKTPVGAAYEDSIYPRSETSMSSLDSLPDTAYGLVTEKRSGTPSPTSSSDEAIWATGRETREGVPDKKPKEQDRGRTTSRRHLWTVNGPIVYHGGVRRRGKHAPSGKRRAAREPHQLLFDIQEE